MFLDSSLIINHNVFDTIKDISICSICTGVIIDPQQCLSCDSCFCKGCIGDWLKKSKTCPLKCPNSTFKDSRIVRQMIARLIFKCEHGCVKELTYEEVFNHANECENLTGECPTCKTVVSRNKIKIEQEKTIKALKDEVELLKKKLQYYEIMEVPTMFNNTKKEFITPPGNFLRTISSMIPLPENFSISLRLIKLEHPGHMVIGLSDKIINENKGYLGGDLGNGNWGVAGNGALGEEGLWRKGNCYKQGDILTLKGRGSEVTYLVNGKGSDYSFNLKNRPLYFSVSFYYENEVIELLNNNS